MATDRSTRDEDDLKSSLERTRRSKLSALHHTHHTHTHHHLPRVSSGTPARGPRRLREDKSYGRVNRKRSPHAPRVHPSPAHTRSHFASPSHTRSHFASPSHTRSSVFFSRSSMSSSSSSRPHTPPSARDHSDMSLTPRRPDAHHPDHHTPPGGNLFSAHLWLSPDPVVSLLRPMRLKGPCHLFRSHSSRRR